MVGGLDVLGCYSSDDFVLDYLDVLDVIWCNGLS